MRRPVRWIAGAGLALAVLAIAAPAQADLPVPTAPFDVTEATRAYLNTLQGAARAKSDAYFEGGYWLILWGAVVSVVVDLVLLRFGIAARLRDIGIRVAAPVSRLSDTVRERLRSKRKQRLRRERPAYARAGVTWVAALLYLVVTVVLTLPWTIYSGFVRERQYGLMNQTFAAWAGDQAKAFAVSLVLVPLVVMAIYAVIRRSPRHWWIYGTGVAAVFLTFGAILGPVYIAPLFNKYTELPAGPARTRIVQMAQAKGIPASHIYLFDASKQSKRISANVSGLGPTIRISVNDNLINRTTLPETAAVVGHEMGHYVLGHARRGIVFLVLLTAACLFIISRVAPVLIRRNMARWGVNAVSDPASIPVLSILLTILGLIATPITNTITRTAESDADKFGLDTAREPDGFASVAMKLSEYRKIEPDPLEEIVFFDHPSGATRVRMAMQWKKDHVPDAAMVVPPPIDQDTPSPR